MNNEKVDKKWKRSLVYVQRGKRYEEELTYERFVQCLHDNLEFFFMFNDTIIDIATHSDNGIMVYELNINGYTNDAKRFCFNSVNQLLEYAIIGGMTLKDLWQDLRT